MKLFAFIFLFGLAAASFHEILDERDEQDFLLGSEQNKGKDDLQTELGRKLRETLDHILKQIKKAVQDGKGVSKELLDEARDLVNKLKKYGMDVSEEAKDLLNYLGTRVERWAKELLDILNDNSSTIYRAEENVITEFGKKLRETLRHVLREIKKTVEEGKHVSQRLRDQAKDLIIKLKKYGLDVSEEVKDMLEYLKKRIAKWAEELLDALRGKHSNENKLQRLIDHFKLRERLEKLKQMIEDSESLSSIEEYIKEHLSDSSYVRNRLINYLEEGKDILKSALNRLLGHISKRSLLDKLKKKIEEYNLGETLRKLKELVDSKFDSVGIKDFIKEKIPDKAGLIRDYLTKAVDKGKEAFGKILEMFQIGNKSF